MNVNLTSHPIHTGATLSGIHIGALFPKLVSTTCDSGLDGSGEGVWPDAPLAPSIGSPPTAVKDIAIGNLFMQSYLI